MRLQFSFWRSSNGLPAGLIPASEYHPPIRVDLGLGELDQIPDIARLPAPVPLVVAVDIEHMPANQPGRKRLRIAHPLPQPESLFEQRVPVHLLPQSGFRSLDLGAIGAKTMNGDAL